ncbi:MAG: restriction endonuclease subunit S [Oscillospiraceae bacterium]|nr:restriction endonuclease subunit S [Oscillospiraceae bacterium]
MRAMKESGVWWIDTIPEKWNVLKAKHCITITNGSDPQTEGEIPVYGSGEKQFKTCGEFKNPPAVLIGRKGTVNKPRYIESAYWNVDTAFDVKPQNNMNLRYYYYLAISFDYDYYTSQTTLPSMTQTGYENMSLPLPCLDEQQAISAYLDRQCVHIDNTIEKTKASIEEYKKLRQAVITQAVTKGVRGERAMKDSGIEWIGEIPEEWEIVKFKYAATVKSNLVHPNEYLNYMQIAPDNIEKGTSKLLECKTVEEIGVESDNHLFYKGQIIYSKIRPILNKVIIAPFDGLCSADMYPIETTINKYFLVYMMLSDRFLSQVKLVTENRVKMPKINQEELGQILIYLPTTDEQQEIAAYLDKKCAEIDALITKKEQFLTELESYKKSMIYEYVTGKKEVPQA